MDQGVRDAPSAAGHRHEDSYARREREHGEHPGGGPARACDGVALVGLPVEVRAIRTSRPSIEVPEVQARRHVDRAALSLPAHRGHATPSATVPSSSVMVLPPHGQRQDHHQVDREPDHHVHDGPPHLDADRHLPRSAEHKPFSEAPTSPSVVQPAGTAGGPGARGSPSSTGTRRVSRLGSERTYCWGRPELPHQPCPR
jgi:hypothetical protein